MLVLSRAVGESVVIEDVNLCLVRTTSQYAEVSLTKLSGGKSVVVTLPLQKKVDICYDVEAVFVATNGEKARLGFEYPNGVSVLRREFWGA